MDVEEALGILAGGCFMLLFVGAVGFGLDCGIAQMVLWALGSFQIIAGFWQALFLVVTAEAVVSASIVSSKLFDKLFD